MTSHNEAQKTKTDWLKSEIEKLEVNKYSIPPHVIMIINNEREQEIYNMGKRYGNNQALTSIITRYKEELLELEKGV